MTGTLLGQYRLDSLIGRGPLGEVRRAMIVNRPSEFVAIKFLLPALSENPEIRDRLQAGIPNLRKLDHPHLARILDFGEYEGRLFIVSEWVDGTDLETILRSSGRLAWPEVLDIAFQAAAVLRHGHVRGLLHRDLKPANLFRCPDGSIRVTDFGPARLVHPDPPHLLDNVVGTIAYLAPELSNGKQQSKKADLYALGGVLFTLLTGRPPFAGKTVMELLHKHASVQPERPSRLVADLPHDLDDLILNLLAKDPKRRPADAAIVLKDLERIRSKLARQGKPVLPMRSTLQTESIETDSTEEPDPTVEPPPTSPPAIDESMSDRRGLLNRGIILIPAFLLVCGLILAILLRPRPSAEELWAAAQPLLASDDPAAWEQARTEYLDLLSVRYPDFAREEVTAAIERSNDLREQRRSIAAGALVKPTSEAERFYLEGLHWARLGETNRAKRIWELLLRTYAGVTTAKHWTSLAAVGLKQLERPLPEPLSKRPRSGDYRTDAGVQTILAKAQVAFLAGRSAEADALWQGLEALYRGSPEEDGLREWIAQERKRALESTVPKPSTEPSVQR